MTPAPTSGKAAAWLEALALAAIGFYQVALRPLNPWGCKFHPSCSHYAREAIELHGLRRGLRLAGGRLLRCRPGTLGGYDPVPSRNFGTLASPEWNTESSEQARA